jgi:putative membrane protein
MFKHNRIHVALALALAIPLSAFAADALSSKDKQFIAKAAQAGHAEVAAGKIANSKSTNDEVKKFGDQMVQDHGKANDELGAIAKTKGITPPSEPDAAHKKLASQLEKAKPGEFDKLYVREAGVKDHKAAVALFTDESKNGKDAELKAFAQKTLSTIQHHYEMAQDLAKKK